jgi:hypothetical protein
MPRRAKRPGPFAGAVEKPPEGGFDFFSKANFRGKTRSRSPMPQAALRECTSSSDCAAPTRAGVSSAHTGRESTCTPSLPVRTKSLSEQQDRSVQAFPSSDCRVVLPWKPQRCAEPKLAQEIPGSLRISPSLYRFSSKINSLSRRHGVRLSRMPAPITRDFSAWLAPRASAATRRAPGRVPDRRNAVKARSRLPSST